MKKAIILIFGSVLSLMTYSQNYYPVVGEDKTWNVLSVVVNYPFPWDTTFSTISYKLTGDTVINSVTYKKMYSSCEEIPINWNLCCFMREDTNRRVWLKDSVEEDEFLMYDFMINEGDSIQVGYGESVYLYVDSINSVTVNGTLRPKYWMSCKVMPDYRETWIEGVGSNKGIVWSGSALLVGGWTWLLCMSEDGELIYMNPYFNSCYLISTDIIEENSALIQVYPNPAKNKLKIENVKNIKIESISIIDFTGKKIKQFEPKKTHLDISGITSGIYFLKISYEKGEINKKIIIE